MSTEQTFNSITNLIQGFQESLNSQLPALERELDDLIKSNTQDTNTIERHLDILLSLIDVGVGKDLFIKLLEYYKTIDSEGADYYWNAFDSDDED